MAKLYNKLENLVKKYVAKPLVMAGLAGVLFTGNDLYAQNSIKWRQEYAAVVNGRYMSDAYVGGISGRTPAFVDIDNDGDYDMFTGSCGAHGTSFYRNDGDSRMPNWVFITNNYLSDFVDYGYYMPSYTFCDIDDDGDFDLLVGHEDGYTSYRNDGTPTSPSWTLDNDTFDLGWLGHVIRPTFVDIDADGDHDMFMGNSNGRFYFFRNEGTPTSPSWELESDNYNDISTFELVPRFVDIDNDGDYDMFIGKLVPPQEGTVSFYLNNGCPRIPNWIFVTDSYNSISVGNFISPAFVDIDDDRDPDMFVGYAGLNFWRNMGIEKTLKADLNNDGIINFKDFAIFAEQWLMKEPWYDSQ